MKIVRNISILLITLFSISFTACTNSVARENDKDKKIKVAVFNGNGAGAVSVIETIEALKIDTGIKPLEISAAEIQQGKLSEIDVIIFPGGSGSKELNNLGKTGKEKVRKFILEDGKGVVGICAGSFLLSSTPGYPSLQLGSVKVIDRAHYARGKGLVEFKLNEEGLKIFPELKDKPQFAQYYDGPVMEAVESNSKFTELGQYVTDIHPNKGAPEGVTPGKVFIYKDTPGKGKLFAVAGHPESTPGVRWMIPRMARWVAGAELVSYNEKWVRPEINNEAILYDSEMKKYEKHTWWNLFSEDSNEQIEALDKLHKIRSRPAVRWTVGLLRDSNPETRMHAAKTLMDREYTDAFTDVKSAYEVEENSDVKEVLKEAVEFLSTF
ncbi:MAG: BPL-N domain-containing protein [Bacteroidota bacterium]